MQGQIFIDLYAKKYKQNLVSFYFCEDAAHVGLRT